MRRRKRHLWLLVLSVLSFVGLAIIIVNYSPSQNLSIIGYQLSLVAVFLTILFLFIFSFFAFILNNSRRGFLLGLLVISYLLLKLAGLTSPFFAILLLILFGVIELFFIKRK